MAQPRNLPPMILVRPPDDALFVAGWHTVRTKDGGVKRLQWQPGLLIWRSEEGLTWASETAGRLGWSYLGPADAPRESPKSRHAAPHR